MIASIDIEPLPNVYQVFDQQEKKHRSNKDSYKAKLTKIDRILFDLTKSLTLDDWRIIRAGDFWKLSDAIKSELGKKMHLLKHVKQYLKIQ